MATCPKCESQDAYTENGKQIAVRSNVKKEDTDMIQIFTNIDTLVQLTKDIPLNMEIKQYSEEH